MKYLSPFVIHGAHQYDTIHLKKELYKFNQIIKGLMEGSFEPELFPGNKYLNDLITGD